MCGRYTFTPHKDILGKKTAADAESSYLMELSLLPAEFTFSSYNIAPTNEVPVIREPGKIEMMKWWLIPGYEREFKAGKYSMFNKKSEELDKPYWQKLLKRGRCVLPMSGFIEWKKIDTKKKIPYHIQPLDDCYFWAACLYDTWVDRETGEAKRSFTILTMSPNAFMADIHNRMPVLLNPQVGDVHAWLSTETERPEDLFKPFPPGRMKKHRISNDIGNVANNHPGLLQPVPEENELF